MGLWVWRVLEWCGGRDMSLSVEISVGGVEGEKGFVKGSRGCLCVEYRWVCV